MGRGGETAEERRVVEWEVVVGVAGYGWGDCASNLGEERMCW
jgi:hypothetical protein